METIQLLRKCFRCVNYLRQFFINNPTFDSKFTMNELEDGPVLEELCNSSRCTDKSEQYFAQVIGCIEEIIVDEKFVDLQHKFMEEYWGEFDNNEENKLVYMDIFKKYVEVVEKYIEEQLTKNINGFNMKTFEAQLEQKQNELVGEIFEMLTTFSDFEAFKNMFLDYKAMKEGKTLDFSKDVSISKYCLL